MRIGLPGNCDGIADDVLGDVDLGIDLGEAERASSTRRSTGSGSIFKRVGHPTIGEADDAGLVRPVIEEIGAAASAGRSASCS